MNHLKFEFIQDVPRNGFAEVAGGGYRPNLKGGSKPTHISPGVHREFVAIESPEMLHAFLNRNGELAPEPSDPDELDEYLAYLPDHWNEVYKLIDTLASILKEYDAVKHAYPTSKREKSYKALVREFKKRGRAESPAYRFNVVGGKIRFVPQFSTLLSYIFFQAAAEMGGALQLRSCRVCKTSFHAVRSDAVYCEKAMCKKSGRQRFGSSRNYRISRVERRRPKVPSAALR
jgi:hypothetical protein